MHAEIAGGGVGGPASWSAAIAAETVSPADPQASQIDEARCESIEPFTEPLVSVLGWVLLVERGPAH